MFIRDRCALMILTSAVDMRGQISGVRMELLVSTYQELIGNFTSNFFYHEKKSFSSVIDPINC